MKLWTSASVLQDQTAPAEVRMIAAMVHEALYELEADGFPRLASIAHHDHDDDHMRYHVLVELAPGIKLPTEYGMPDQLQAGYEKVEEDVDVVFALVMEGVDACLPILPTIASALHEQRVQVREIISGWARDGIHARLAEVRLAPYDHWRGEKQPATTVMLEGLGEQLRTEIFEVPVPSPVQLEAAFEECRLDIEAYQAMWLEVSALGATGRIDRLALNAIAHHGDTAETLRRFGSEWRFWLPDSTALIFRHGRVSAGTGDPDYAIDWGRNMITIWGRSVPETVLTAAIGKPVTAIVDHPFLTDDITVLEATSSVEDGRSFVSVSIAVPQFLFCSDSGKVWEEAPAADDDASNVVAFRSATR